MDKDFELRTVLSAYDRYLNSLKKKESDVERNFKAMKDFICVHCDNEEFKNHWVQDAFLNMLRSTNLKYDEIKPSSALTLLVKSQGNYDEAQKALPNEKEIEQEEFIELKEHYFNLLNDTVTNELSWKKYDAFRRQVLTDIETSAAINPNVRQRVINVLKMKLEKLKWKLL